MITRPWRTWIAFVLCLAVVLAALGWISVTALRLDQDVAFEGNVRIGLWRMDSALAPIIAQESVRPYFSYTAFYSADRAYANMFAGTKGNDAQPPPQLQEVQLPSQILLQDWPYIQLHFQFDPGGTLSSPQVPVGKVRKVARAGYVTDEEIDAASARLANLEGFLDREVLLAALPEGDPPPIVVASIPLNTQLEQNANFLPTRQVKDLQQIRNDQEWQARVGNIQQAAIRGQKGINRSLIPPNVSVGVPKPLWIGSELVLVRRASLNGGDYVQGCWFDWQALKNWLLEGVADLLPDADLEPARGEPGEEGTHLLAALPIRLIPGEVPTGLIDLASPMRFSLAIAWGCALLGAAAVAWLLRGAMSLSERRGAFVSAVTHELRTPLTTFRMYTEMLDEGMVREEEKRRHYLSTLRIEAERLSLLMENVLAYSRLERGRTGRRVERVTLRELIGRVKGRLADRAKRADMDLVVEDGTEGLEMGVQTDTQAVEQILFNLVDNACKYAASASDRRIHLEAGRMDGLAALRIRDHGPGVSRGDARRLFRPFCKSARDAANSAPGVGLGLALSRRLARNVGGDLRLDGGARDGACFILTLPAR